MSTVQKTCVGFKQFLRMAHRELREITDIFVQDEEMHHANIVHYVVAGLQEVL